MSAAALRRTERLNEGADDFPQQLMELTRFLDDDFPDGHPYALIHAVPGPVQATSEGGVQSPNLATAFSIMLMLALPVEPSYSLFFCPSCSTRKR